MKRKEELDGSEAAQRQTAMLKEGRAPDKKCTRQQQRSDRGGDLIGSAWWDWMRIYRELSLPFFLGFFLSGCNTHMGIALNFKISNLRSQNLTFSGQECFVFEPGMFWLEFASALHLSCHERLGTLGCLRDILWQERFNADVDSNKNTSGLKL